VYVFLCLCTGREALRRLITSPRSHTECLRSSKLKWNGEFHRGRSRPKLGLLRQNEKKKHKKFSTTDCPVCCYFIRTVAPPMS
jgi:hypothetical protein